MDHEYEIEADGRETAEVADELLRARGTSVVEIVAGENNALVLAVQIAVDNMAQRSERALLTGVVARVSVEWQAGVEPLALAQPVYGRRARWPA